MRPVLLLVACASLGCSLALDYDRAQLRSGDDAAADVIVDIALPDAPPSDAVCPAGFGDCNGVASDGCETDLSTSATHCGACATACQSPARCVAGVCPGTTCRAPMRACGSACVDLLSNPQHCGACNADCPSGSPRCCNGACRSRCN
jgi:hypothetical protein